MNDEIKGYKRLLVWQKAHQFVLLVYKYTKEFPKYELFGLTAQIRRAVISIGANIVEGQASNSKKEFLSFLNMANRSLVETEYFLETAVDLGYLKKEEFNELENLRHNVGNLLNGLMRSIKLKLNT